MSIVTPTVSPAGASDALPMAWVGFTSGPWQDPSTFATSSSELHAVRRRRRVPRRPDRAHDARLGAAGRR